MGTTTFRTIQTYRPLGRPEYATSTADPNTSPSPTLQPASNDEENDAMRFMMMIKPNLSDEAWTPSGKDVDRMVRMKAYNDELTKAGVLLAVDGLAAPSKGARVRFEGGRTTVVDGPFTETREVIGGYWVIEAGSKQEAVEWARRVPAADGDEVEVRQVAELADFPPEVADVLSQAE
jgi:hypothetical protein